MDKQELYNLAKDTYYNGEPIMSDAEFDELESELGLENKGYVGSKSKHYTCKHPFIMGSISKVQIHKESEAIDFSKYQQEVEKYLKKSRNYGRQDWYFETTPKLDGCSIEVCFDHKGELISVSTRGDGSYGKDIKDWFMYEWETNFKNKVHNWINQLDEDSFMYIDKFVARGECLVKKNIFAQKYSEDFTIPRSFVSGVINSDWEGTFKQIEMRKDLSFVFYDYREVYENGTIYENDYNESYPGNIIDYRQKHSIEDIKNLEKIYYDYENYRHNISEYELDGIVIKPGVNFRLQDLTRPRQEDQVAIKFTPEIVETEIIDIDWSVSKNAEYIPTGILKEVILGGKKVNRVSLHNYDYIIRNSCDIGAKVNLILSGDIIPHINKVVKGCKEQPGTNIPEDSYIIQDMNSGCFHLMKNMSEADLMYNKFLTSVKTLKIDGIGEQVAKRLYYLVGEKSNIIEFMTDDMIGLIHDCLGESKSTSNIIHALTERQKNLSLSEIIESCAIENCGPKNSLWLAKKISGIDVPNDGIPSTIIDFYEHGDLSEIKKYINLFNIPMLSEEKTDDKIPVILTGDTSNTQYATKKQWLLAHPQYVETTSWKECKILFTNDLSSTTSKMTKARKNGIEIRVYED